MQRSSILIILIFVLLSFLSCSKQTEPETPLPSFPHDECNSVYYWRTEFRLDCVEKEFIRNHDVKKMYIRFFDVIAEDYYLGNKGSKELRPNATISFTDSVPASVCHVVPTVFITVDALRNMSVDITGTASKIVRRVLNMVSFNEIPNVGELQLDCDWTTTTENIYFKLCEAVAIELGEQADTAYTLSSTIRLHQLQKKTPPVDYGVLMCYNTGSFRNPNATNSILDYKDVEPYLRRAQTYPLHLDLALPIYEWTLCYRDGHFNGIVRSDSLEYHSVMKDVDNLYMATTNAVIGNRHIKEGDVFRHEKPDFSTIAKTKELVNRNLITGQHSVVLYHLDSKNINRFSDDEISQIYRCDSI